MGFLSWTIHHPAGYQVAITCGWWCTYSLEQDGIRLLKLTLEVSWDAMPVKENALAGVIHQVSEIYGENKGDKGSEISR